MNEQVKGLKALTSEQRNIIKKLLYENRHLRLQNRALSKRNQDLEETSVVIDREIAEIPIGFDLIPESDLNRY
jgi:regulator of replication initiation timing